MQARESLQGKLPAASQASSTKNSTWPPLTKKTIPKTKVRAVNAVMRVGHGQQQGGIPEVIEDNIVTRVIAEKRWVLTTGQDSLEGGEGQAGMKGLEGLSLEVLRSGAIGREGKSVGVGVI